jgi:uncharacterized protein (TIGR02001 family)
MPRNLVKSTVAALLAVPAIAAAQPAPAPAAPTSPHAFTGNANIVSDYRFRGISQTKLGPAFQGGFEYNHASGFYLGNWNSNVSGLNFPNGAGLELDVSAGYKKTIGDFGFDVGYLYYYYPGNWKFVSAKLWYSVSDYFGLNNDVATAFYANKDTGAALATRGGSRGTIYYDLNVNYEVAPKLTLNLHAGYTDVKNYNQLDYFDYKVGATYDLNGWQLGAAFVGTDADKQWYYVRDGLGRTKETGKTSLVLSIGKTF